MEYIERDEYSVINQYKNNYGQLTKMIKVKKTKEILMSRSFNFNKGAKLEDEIALIRQIIQLRNPYLRLPKYFERVKSDDGSHILILYQE